MRREEEEKTKSMVMRKKWKMQRKGIRASFFGLLLIPAFAIGGIVSLQETYTRNITKTFTVENGADLHISNKYGKVTLQRSAGNQIKAVITITVKAASEADAKSLASQVTIQSSQSSNRVSLTTEYGEGRSSSFWKRFFGETGDPRKYIHIDYLVYVPASIASTDLTNNFGDVAGDNIPGNLNLKLNYGNFHIGRVGGAVDLHANYCSGSLNGIASGSIHANYTDVRLDKVDNLSISSNYSNYKISQAGNIEMSSNYGNITGEDIATITSSSTYGDYRITNLEKSGHITTVYGDVRISDLGSNFDTLTINPTYSDITIGIPGSLHVHLDVRLTRGDIGTGDVSLERVQRTDAHGTTSLNAEAAGEGPGTSLIKINGTYSDVNFKKR